MFFQIVGFHTAHAGQAQIHENDDGDDRERRNVVRTGAPASGPASGRNGPGPRPALQLRGSGPCACFEAARPRLAGERQIRT